jgi:arylsulfatase A-like enzyme
MKKRHYITLIAAVLAAVVPPCGHSAERKPNIILFLVDDMGWMDCEPYGSQYYETPNLTRLAKQGMRFTQAYAAPACSPTRASILTGQSTARHGVTGALCHLPPKVWRPYPPAAPPTVEHLRPNGELFLDPGLPTLAQSLKAAGYHTGHFGKWHLGLLRENWPDRYGFDEIWHCAPDPAPPSYFSPYGVHPDGEPSPRHKVGNITDGPEGEHITDRLTEEAIGFITANKDRPFYLSLWHYSVHSPFEGKEEEMQYFAKKTDPTGRQGNPIMASMLKTMDDGLGRVLDCLDELDIAENTLLVFLSDNGGPKTNLSRKPADNPARLAYDRWAHGLPATNNEPLRAGKLHVYEGGIRVPLIVRWPGQVAAGSVRDDLVAAEDLFPTVLDLLDLPAPEGGVFDGVTFLPALTGKGDSARREVFTWWPYMVGAGGKLPPVSYPGAALRSGDWKLIRFFEDPSDAPRIQLYNLRDDIGETNNLAAKHPERVAELSARIDEILADSGARLPKPNPAFKK